MQKNISTSVACPRPNCGSRVKVPRNKKGIATCKCPFEYSFEVDTRSTQFILSGVLNRISTRIRRSFRPPALQILLFAAIVWLPVLWVYSFWPYLTPLLFSAVSAISAAGCLTLYIKRSRDDRADVFGPLFLVFLIWAVTSALSSFVVYPIDVGVQAVNDFTTRNELLKLLSQVRRTEILVDIFPEPLIVLLIVACLLPILVLLQVEMSRKVGQFVKFYTSLFGSLSLAVAGIFAFAFVSANSGAFVADSQAKLTEQVGRIDTKFKGLLNQVDLMLRRSAADELSKAAIETKTSSKDVSETTAPRSGVSANTCDSEDTADNNGADACPSPSAHEEKPATANKQATGANWPYNPEQPEDLPGGPSSTQEQGARRAAKTINTTLVSASRSYSKFVKNEGKRGTRGTTPGNSSIALLNQALASVEKFTARESHNADRATTQEKPNETRDSFSQAVENALGTLVDAGGESMQSELQVQITKALTHTAGNTVAEFFSVFLFSTLSAPVVEAIKEEARLLSSTLANGVTKNAASRMLNKAASKIHNLSSAAHSKIYNATSGLRRLLDGGGQTMERKELLLARKLLQHEAMRKIEKVANFGRLMPPATRQEFFSELFRRHDKLEPLVRIAADGAILRWLDKLDEEQNLRRRFDLVSNYSGRVLPASTMTTLLDQEISKASRSASASLPKNFQSAPSPVQKKRFLAAWAEIVANEAFDRASRNRPQSGGWKAKYDGLVASKPEFSMFKRKQAPRPVRVEPVPSIAKSPIGQVTCWVRRLRRGMEISRRIKWVKDYSSHEQALLLKARCMKGL